MRSGARKTNKKKKTHEVVKQELLASLVEHSDGEGDYSELNGVVRNAKELKDGIDLVKNMKMFWKARIRRS